MSGLVPVFAVEGGAALVLARGLAVLGTLTAFGTLLFAVLVLPRSLARAAPDLPPRLWVALRRLALAELGVAACATLAWLLLGGAAMAGAEDARAALAALPVVLRDTAFGHLVALTLALLGGVALALGGGATARRRRAACGLAAVAVVLQGGHGHGWSMQGAWLLVVSDVVHLASAGAWLGGLPALLLVVGLAPPATGATAARWFTPLGKACVAGIVVSAGVQAWGLVGSVPGLLGTAYGWTALLKLALLGVLLGFAVLNRYRLAPALRGERPGRARRRLVAAVAVQSGFGLAVVLASALLASLPPAIHEQPLWPFPLRPSLAVLDDPDLRREVALGLALLAGGVAAAVLAVARRRLRWPALGLAGALAWLAAPHLALLLVDAYPTSYETSPTGFAAATIVQGAALFGPNCAACHGAAGRGDGPLAASLAVPPADLTAPHLWEHTDGELSWWLGHGIEAEGGGMAMPGFAATLDADQRWALIDFVRASNAGASMRGSGRWEHPVPVPGFVAACPGGPAEASALRGRVVRLVVAGGAGDVAPDEPGRVDVFVPGPPPEESGACSASDPALPAALAVLAGQTVAQLAGEQFLVDPDGWLRARWRPGEAGAWDRPAGLAAAIAAIRAAPIGPAGDAHAPHRH